MWVASISALYYIDRQKPHPAGNPVLLGGAGTSKNDLRSQRQQRKIWSHQFQPVLFSLRHPLTVISIFPLDNFR